MPNRRPPSYEDEVGRVKRVDRRALRIIAKHGARNDRDVFVLDPEASPERLGNRRKRRA